MNGENGSVLRALSLAVSHVGLAVLAGVGGYIYGTASAGKKEIVGAETTLAMGAVAVTTAPASRITLKRALRLTGTIAPAKKVTAVPKLPGKIVELNVSEGDVVEKEKTVLAVIEHEELVAQKGAALAGIDVALAQLARLDVNLEQARRDLERTRSLRAEGGVSEEILEKARSAVDSLVAQKNVLHAQMKQLRANVDVLKLRIEDATILSPASGTVTDLYDYDLGDTVAPGRPFCEVAELARLKGLLVVTEDDLAPLKGGEKVRLEAPALGVRVFEGTVDKLPQALDPRNRTGIVEVGVGNEEGLLRPGMFVSAAAIIEERKDALAVPEAAVVQRGGRSVVYVIRDGKAMEAEVKLGLRALNLVELLEGPGEGDEIVTGGAKMLTHGTIVKVVER